MKKLIVGISAESSVALLEGQMLHFKKKGYETYLISPASERVREYCAREECKHLTIRIRRDISVLYDLISLFHILFIFIRIRPDVINLGTPKVSLLGMMAGKLLGIRNRIYTCRGFRFEYEKGFKRKILIAMEKVTAACAHKIICISPSVRKFGIENGIFKTSKAVVIHKGSSNGISLIRFNPKKINRNEKIDLQKRFKTNNYFVFGFLGRIYDRKGINELYYAFCKLRAKYSNIILMIVGRFEISQISNQKIINDLKKDKNVVLTGPQPNVPLFLSIMDVFVLPTWGEGFGNVYIQAAAMGIPVIGTTSTGAIDAVQAGFNGFQVPPREVKPLIEKMEKLYLDQDHRKKFGKNGIEWAKNFDSQIIWDGMEKLYQER